MSSSTQSLSTLNSDRSTFDLAAYHTFLKSKRVLTQRRGFEVSIDEITSQFPFLWLWQALIVQWALRLGCAALFEDCGLGKTIQQLIWAYFVHLYTGKPVLILCPLSVAWQTKDEAVRFGIPCPASVIECQSDIGPDAGIVIANYEKLHLFDCSQFGGVVLDESSILKAFTGKIKQQLIYEFRFTPFKLACTATPAPNDYLELGNHAEFLGVMPSNEMIARWFINDGKNVGVYRLKKHGEEDFWRWVASWAVCIAKPSDLGPQFTKDDFILPQLNIHEHTVESSGIPDGYLINPGAKVSATNKHDEKRASLDDRCKIIANLAMSNKEPWALWCETDYEANCILKHLGVKGDGKDDFGGIVEVRGSHSNDLKRDRLSKFVNSEARVIVTKSSIAGYGSNWQHCWNTAFFATFSYEDLYQLIRRFLRYGQKSPHVNCHLITSENEANVVKTTKEKEAAHVHMKSSMSSRMSEFTQEQIYQRPVLAEYKPLQSVAAPSWLKSNL